MKLGFLYAGQGSQHVGMGADLYNDFTAFRKTWDTLETDFDLKQVCFDDPDTVLAQTQYTQPCMVAFAAGVTAVLKENGITPAVTAGLSLGEYSALHAAGVMDAKTAVSMVAQRGKMMEQASHGYESAMTAVLGLDEAAVQSCCEKAAQAGIVSIANYNCPGQIVIGGEKDAVEKATQYAKDSGAKRCIPLKVSGAFHTPLMAPAAKELQEYFETVSFHHAEVPVLFNTIGGVKPNGISTKQLLVKQVQSSVRMEEILHTMADMKVDAIVEIGPGKALSGFARKTIPQVPIYNVEKTQDIETLLTNLKAFAKEAS